MENYITVQELAFLVGCSAQTIGSYYKFKKENPDNELSKMLPDYVRIGNKHTRYWKEEDAEAIKEFRKKLPQGRNGALGSVTQRYVKKNHEASTEEGKPLSKKHYVTREDYQMAEDIALSGMAKYMSMFNRNKDDDETMFMMLDLITQVTTKIESLLFQDEEETSIADGKEVFELKAEPRINVVDDEK